MIFAAVPAGSDETGRLACPAPISPTTGSFTGASSVAVTTSAWCTA